MAPHTPLEHTVTPAENGMKLMNFIERRLMEPAPSSVIHKWIRSGQVRINKKRAKPFDRLCEGDCVRIPPFAKLRPTDAPAQSPLNLLSTRIPIVFANKEILVINKPSGLAVHPGTGITDSVTQLLQSAYAGSSFIPAPAHRLDKNTSGLLAIGLTHTSLAELGAWFAQSSGAQKLYLALVKGLWQPPSSVLEDYICKGSTDNQNMRVVTASHPHALFARSQVTRLATTAWLGQPASLLEVQLQTGRTHQIRAQLATRGFPVIGDVRYGGPEHFPMLLHACRLTLPSGETVTCLPDWAASFAVPLGRVYGQNI